MNEAFRGSMPEHDDQNGRRRPADVDVPGQLDAPDGVPLGTGHPGPASLNGALRGWMSEAEDHVPGDRPVHWVPPACHTATDADGRTLFLAQCGVACYPQYNATPAGQAALYARCQDCENNVPCPTCAREADERQQRRLLE